MFKDKTLLITGGTGSFGNAVLKRFLDIKMKEIRIFSRDELKQDDMRKSYNDDKLKFYLGDIREKKSIDNAMKGVDYIFHAAALKQVPSCEFFPIEAVKTNILGTDNLLRSAEEFGVSKVIVLSTDKAAYPINSMGISKAMIEKVMIARSRSNNSGKQVFCGTRYGNVMGSRGSVIPLFIKQIKNNKAITITEPNMSRFMMTIDEAVELVLYAFENGNSGDIFVQKSPSATIEILAKALLELFGSKNEINLIGKRHGEKSYETLVGAEDMYKAKDLGDYYQIPSDNRDLNYEKYFSIGHNNPNPIEEYNSNNTTRLSIEEMKELLLKLPMVRENI